MAERLREVTMLEIATAMGAGRVTIRDRAAREGWPYREIPAPGRPRRLYKISALPADIRERLDTPTHANSASSQTKGEAGAVTEGPAVPAAIRRAAARAVQRPFNGR